MSSSLEGLVDYIDEDESGIAPEQSHRLPLSAPVERLDKVLACLVPGQSRSRLQQWIENGAVRVDDRPAQSVRQKVGPGQRISWQPQPEPEQLAFQPEPISLAIVDEHVDWIVVDKPAGLVVHPAAGNWSGTLLNGLLYRYPELVRVARAGIVHRLDKDTSGLLVVARSETARQSFVRQLQERSMGRQYRALAWGRVAAGLREAPIGRDPRLPTRMTTRQPIAPKPAYTLVEPLAYGRLAGREVTWVSCRLQTGRTHQIRVHLAQSGNPLVADEVYGGATEAGAKRQMLHATELVFEAPDGSGKRLYRRSWPADMQAVLAAVVWDSPPPLEEFA
jgi:23S rRNA pseudouridine1911/1915/1917 synthase